MYLDDLVVGSDDDMQAWGNGGAWVLHINNRGGQEYGYAGQITGLLPNDGRIFVLTPEPLQP